MPDDTTGRSLFALCIVMGLSDPAASVKLTAFGANMRPGARRGRAAPSVHEACAHTSCRTPVPCGCLLYFCLAIVDDNGGVDAAKRQAADVDGGE